MFPFHGRMKIFHLIGNVLFWTFIYTIKYQTILSNTPDLAGLKISVFSLNNVGCRVSRETLLHALFQGFVCLFTSRNGQDRDRHSFGHN